MHLKFVHSYSNEDKEYKLCMDAHGTSDGSPVKANECIDGDNHQKWKLYPN